MTNTVLDSDTVSSATQDGSGHGHIHSEHRVGHDSKSAGSHDDVPPGMHRMPDGTLMADDAHVVQKGMGEDEQVCEYTYGTMWGVFSVFAYSESNV